MNNNNTYCAKCCTNLSRVAVEKIVRDIDGNEFCGRDCRREWFAENRKEMDCRYGEFVGMDN